MNSRVTFLFSIFLSFFSVYSSYAQNIYDVARSGTSEELTIILEENPSVINSKNKDGYSPLILAAYHSNTSVVRTLIEKGALVNEDSSYGSALMAATVKGAVDIVQLLLENNADPNIADANGTTALLYATMFQQDEIAELLLKYDADISLKDHRGNTALDYAVLMKNEALLNLLKKQL